ncbi:glutathione S-transferase [Tothia fuscella]|uniref:Glutathione S-transferase n=1 Tax=Tothia fuscella TaxID=1048955 RepID=A0A9P4TW59_9PEZI|nr:glutathione S-transferase [Tothia fuscella]
MAKLTLLSATPSPYARKNCIAMLEKGIEFDIRNEIPWHAATETPKYNPLEKLPVLLFDDGTPPVYESWLIQEYIVTKYAHQGPRLMPSNIDAQFLCRQIQAMADGACDAVGLLFWEQGRGKMRSPEWEARQLRKVYNVITALDEKRKKVGNGEFLVANELTIADIAAGAFLGLVDLVEWKYGFVVWKEKHPDLVAYFEMLEERPSFKKTKPVMFEITEKVA